MIYFQATKFTADHVDERIEAFIDWYVNDKLKVRYSEKATKISHFVLTLLSNFKKNRGNRGLIFQILWTSDNI